MDDKKFELILMFVLLGGCFILAAFIAIGVAA